MDDDDRLAGRFEAHRPHLRAVAYRLLGSASEADDAVQEAWLRLTRVDAAGSESVRNLGGWLTTVVARVALDMLRSRASRREDPLDEGAPEPAGGVDPEQAAIEVDTVGLAMMVVLDTLSPAERLSFVLHDLFAVPFDEIAPIAGRSSAAVRQLASRGRRRVRGATPVSDVDLAHRRAVVDAFLAAARSGDFDALLALLDPDVVLRADAGAMAIGAEASLDGAAAVAGMFSGRAQVARPALVEGSPGATWAPGRKPRIAFAFTILRGKIVEIDLLGEPDRLAHVQLA